VTGVAAAAERGVRPRRASAVELEFDSSDEAWNWLSHRLTVTGGYRPRPEAFDLFETKLGVCLPGGYRGFVSRFGAGYLGKYFRIAAPNNRAGAPTFDLLSLNQQSARAASPEWIEEVHCRGVPAGEVAGVVARIRRLVFFASLDADEFIGWDPEDVRDSEAPEYGVYILPRCRPPIECAYSFEQFVFDIGLGDRFPDYIPTDREWWREDRESLLWTY
jgi:hypothetical protein